MLLYILISLLAGVSIVIARIINSNLATKIGILSGTFFNYVTGLFFSIIFLFLSKETSNLYFYGLNSVPLWAYLGGLIGVIVVSLSNYVTPKISAFYLTLIIFIGQLFAGIVIDYYTLNIISKGKIIGGILVIVGLTYNLILDKNNSQNKEIAT